MNWFRYDITVISWEYGVYLDRFSECGISFACINDRFCRQ